MAEYNCKLNGDFDDIIEKIHNGILARSVSASYEGGYNYIDGIRISS